MLNVSFLGRNRVKQSYESKKGQLHNSRLGGGRQQHSTLKYIIIEKNQKGVASISELQNPCIVELIKKVLQESK